MIGTQPIQIAGMFITLLGATLWVGLSHKHPTTFLSWDGPETRGPIGSGPTLQPFYVLN
jgi:hypothetical protein